LLKEQGKTTSIPIPQSIHSTNSASRAIDPR
jgi:hypothetical protein